MISLAFTQSKRLSTSLIVSEKGGWRRKYVTHNHRGAAGVAMTGGLGRLPRDHTLENKPKFLPNEFELTPLGQNRSPIEAGSY